ncbi:MAG: hypothetical protein JJU36_14355 [Phycisphaeraceae bacterium]|nr:hypothetical protein [Phycisphaeraceae bacterium]
MSEQSGDSLSAAMSLAIKPVRLWRDHELGAILRHQLDSPVGFDLTELSDGMADRLRTVAQAQGLALRTFADLLFHPSPPVELLILTKDFAKGHLLRRGSPLPRQVVVLLYYAGIVAAMLRCERRISELSDEQLRAGLKKLVEMPWIEPRLRELLTSGMAALQCASEGGQESGDHVENQP